MSRPLNPRMRKDAQHVAARMEAVRAVASAFPDMSNAAIAEALGMGRHAVRHYLAGSIKRVGGRPWWGADFFEVARALCTSQPARAVEPLTRLVRKLEVRG